MELAGPHCVLRPWQPGDEAALARHANNRKIWRNLMNKFPHPYLLENAREYIERCRQAPAPPTAFAITVEGVPVGGAGLEAQDDVHVKMMKLGYWLSEDYWGRGITTEAVRLLIHYAFATFDIERLQAGVFGWNPASARVLEKAGFTFEGRLRNAYFKDGAFTDSLVYGLLRSEVQPPEREV